MQRLMPIIFSILGLVILSALFIPIMNGLAGLYDTPGAENFLLLQLIITILPTILLLAATVALGVYHVGAIRTFTSSDASGLISIVMGAMEIILFFAMFATVITNFATLYSAYGNNTTWIAFGTVLQIVPTLLFLAGAFAGGWMAYSGVRKKFGRGKSSLTGSNA